MGGLWANPAFGNFDDIAAAALLLFEMAGMEGWPDVMYQGIDAVGVDEAPVRDASVASGLFFVLCIVVGPRTPPYPNPNPNPNPNLALTLALIRSSPRRSSATSSTAWTISS